MDQEICFEIIGGGKLELLILCDHASNMLPHGYGKLGLAPAEFERHIAYDIGARDLTLALAARLDCPPCSAAIRGC